MELKTESVTKTYSIGVGIEPYYVFCWGEGGNDNDIDGVRTGG